MRLTTKAIQALKPSDRRQEIKDDGARGLYLFLQPSGQKIWKVIYSQCGRLRKVTLGRFPALGLSDAREAARRTFQQVDSGIDPIEARRQAEAEAEEARSQTFDAVARRYLADNQHLRSIREVENRLRPIIATWDDRPIASIRRREIIALIDRVKAERGGAAAYTWQTWIRRVFSWSLEKSLIEVSPAAGIRRPVPVVYRERALSDDELRRLWPACGEAGHPTGPFFRMLLLTGCRRGELEGLLWFDIDLDRHEIIIPASRYKNGKAHLVPLPRQAVALIEGLPRLADSPYVFTASGKKPLGGVFRRTQELNELIDPPLGKWGPHDLRRTVRTGLSRLGVAPHIAERVLGHLPGGIQRHYDLYQYADEKRATLQLWADHIDAVVSDQRGQVVPLRGVG